MKIAMWSGPRNLSTAMMYSFGNRKDCQITDEPFYAAYLRSSGEIHPMNAQILANQPNNAGDVVTEISKPNSKSIWYQKHMTHHMLPHFPLEWTLNFKNVFLIRHPQRVIASYSAKRDQLSLSDLGFEQQLHIFNFCKSKGAETLIIDSDDILKNPHGMLEGLCQSLGIAFDEDMLSWPAGRRPEDGIWAEHWYDGVHRSTGFGAPKTDLPEISESHQNILEEAELIYDKFKRNALVGVT